MGLDCTAYTKLTRVTNPIVDETGYPVDEDALKVWVQPYFPAQAEGLVDGGVYAYEDATGWRAGSYGTYNRWRNEIARLGGYSADDLFDGRDIDAPRSSEGFLAFEQLVNFSDCDGVIGPVVAARLLKDFEAFDSRAQVALDDYSYNLYQQWTEAFRMAADGGCVKFH